MPPSRAHIAGIGFWADGLPAWPDAYAYARGEGPLSAAPAAPAALRLPPNERRRAPPTVAVALQVADAACRMAGSDPRELPVVFASTLGDMALVDAVCSTLAAQPAALSPIRFHNSVHNAAAGYWAIATGCRRAATALCAGRATFCEALLEAYGQLACGEPRVLVVAYDGPGAGPLAAVAPSEGLLGAALVLSAQPDGPLMTMNVAPAQDVSGTGRLARRYAANAAAPMLPLFDAIACELPFARLAAGAHYALRIGLPD